MCVFCFTWTWTKEIYSRILLKRTPATFIYERRLWRNGLMARKSIRRVITSRLWLRATPGSLVPVFSLHSRVSLLRVRTIGTRHWSRETKVVFHSVPRQRPRRLAIDVLIAPPWSKDEAENLSLMTRAFTYRAVLRVVIHFHALFRERFLSAKL